MVFAVSGVLILPLLGILAIAIPKPASFRLKSHAAILILTSAGVLVFGCLLLKSVLIGPPIAYRIPFYGRFSPTFYIDILSALLLVLTALIWLAVSIYTSKYIVHEGRITLFYVTMIAVLLSVSGVFLSGDLFTLLLFFEIMTITSYFWVIHKGDKSAVTSGWFYLFFSVASGLIIALGIVLMGAAVEELPAIGQSFVPSDPAMFRRGIVLMLIGFGIKAGIVPLHLWLPRAHASAPAPGSALLSGILIKVGAYGFIRILSFVGFSGEAGAMASDFGFAVSVTGGITMLVGVAAALMQSNAKRLLAYHSVSQMGYIILGLGIALYAGNQGGLALSGAVYHIINHALFKSALFLGMGILYLSSGKTDLYDLGSMMKRFPLLAAFMLLAVLGIAGAPGLNGYVSKILIHRGLSGAAESGGGWLKGIEILFNIVGAGTAASFTKLYYLAFIRKASKPIERKPLKKGSVLLYAPIAILSAAMLLIGFFPYPLLRIIGAAADALGSQDAPSLAAGFAFWNIRDIAVSLVTLTLGALVCWVGLKTGAFHRKVPAWLTIEGLAVCAYQGTGTAVLKIAQACRRATGILIKLAGAAKLKIRGVYMTGKTAFNGSNAAAALLVATLLVLTAGYAAAKLKAELSFGVFNRFVWDIIGWVQCKM